MRVVQDLLRRVNLVGRSAHVLSAGALNENPSKRNSSREGGGVVVLACSQCARDSSSVNRRDPLPCMDNGTKTEEIVSFSGEIDR